MELKQELIATYLLAEYCYKLIIKTRHLLAFRDLNPTPHYIDYMQAVTLLIRLLSPVC